MITETLNFQLTRPGSQPRSEKLSLQGDGESNVQKDVPAGAVALAVDFAFSLASAVLIYLVAKADMALATNSTTSPGDTLNLKAGEPLVWHAGSKQPCPFTHDVTGLFVSNAGKSAAELFCHVLKSSPTPSTQTQGAPAPAAAGAAPAKVPAPAPAPNAAPKVPNSPGATAGASSSSAPPNAPPAPSAPTK
jgi:hypothetical protein